MRFMLIIKATRYSEAGVKPSQEFIDAMAEYNESLAKAGVLLATEKLQPSSRALRIAYPVPSGNPKVKVGPFSGEKELVAGFTLIDVNSEEEAIDWALRMPDSGGYGEGVVELRQLTENPEWVRDPKIQAMEADLQELMDMLRKK